MIIDTSVLVAIFFGELEQESFVRTIHTAEDCRIGVVNHLELFMVIEHRLGAEFSRQVDHFLDRARIAVEPGMTSSLNVQTPLKLYSDPIYSY